MAVAALELAVTGHSAQSGRLTLWDAISGAWQTIALARDPLCPVCRNRAQLNQGAWKNGA